MTLLTLINSLQNGSVVFAILPGPPHSQQRVLGLCSCCLPCGEPTNYRSIQNCTRRRTGQGQKKMVLLLRVQEEADLRHLHRVLSGLDFPPPDRIIQLCVQRYYTYDCTLLELSEDGGALKLTTLGERLYTQIVRRLQASKAAEKDIQRTNTNPVSMIHASEN